MQWNHGTYNRARGIYHWSNCWVVDDGRGTSFYLSRGILVGWGAFFYPDHPGSDLALRWGHKGATIFHWSVDPWGCSSQSCWRFGQLFFRRVSRLTLMWGCHFEFCSLSLFWQQPPQLINRAYSSGVDPTAGTPRFSPALAAQVFALTFSAGVCCTCLQQRRARKWQFLMSRSWMRCQA